MNSLVVLLTVQILFSILLIVWVRLKVLRSLDDGDSIARVRREIGALIVELDGSADRNITLIEDRLRELKDCIAEADKRIVMLSNERARTWATPPQRISQDQLQASQETIQAPRLASPTYQSPAQAYQSTVAAGPLPVQNPQPLPNTTLPLYKPRPLEAVQAAFQESNPAKEIERTGDLGLHGSPRSATVPFIRFSDKPLVFEEPFTERVARLYKRGFSSDIIAAKLKATIAEVDLAIAASCNPLDGRGEG